MIARSTTCSKDVAGDDYKVWELKFLRSPVEFLAAEDGTLKGLLLAINTLQVGHDFKNNSGR